LDTSHFINDKSSKLSFITLYVFTLWFTGFTIFFFVQLKWNVLKINNRREEDFIHATVPVKMNEFELAGYRKEESRPDYFKPNEMSPRLPELEH